MLPGGPNKLSSYRRSADTCQQKGRRTDLISAQGELYSCCLYPLCVKHLVFTGVVRLEVKFLVQNIATVFLVLAGRLFGSAVGTKPTVALRGYGVSLPQAHTTALRLKLERDVL